VSIQLRDEPVQFEVGDRIVDGRVPATGTVIRVRGTAVYYRDSCMWCRDGSHHRTQTDFVTTSKAP